ncbi:50S ribosomal protein L11 methyltransferase [Undibacterium luofuense]|uniref:50S ribosomal protein L11 methyltransferase n=1 Tax=Undibacterium luofuense TaxID=2828733 RepID=UPI0030EDBE04
MGWTEIVVEVAREQAEPLSDALMEAGALSVSVEDADEGTEAEKPLFGEPGMEPEETAWERSRVVALADTDIDHADLVRIAAEAIGLAEIPAWQTRSVEEQDWVRLTQSQFAPIHIGKNIWVVPSWHDAPEPDALILELDPGLAFGTGSHPTTRLCMEWLESNTPADKTVLDYGCGSGILAIAALKLGAGATRGIDIDAQAVRASLDNAQQNGVSAEFGLPDTLKAGQYDVVVANILANPLRMLGELLASHVKTGGKIVLSGILAEQAEELSAIYAKWFDMDAAVFDEGWTRLSGTKRP